MPRKDILVPTPYALPQSQTFVMVLKAGDKILEELSQRFLAYSNALKHMKSRKHHYSSKLTIYNHLVISHSAARLAFTTSVWMAEICKQCNLCDRFSYVPVYGVPRNHKLKTENYFIYLFFVLAELTRLTWTLRTLLGAFLLCVRACACGLSHAYFWYPTSITRTWQPYRLLN